jgi:hypothetical protein
MVWVSRSKFSTTQKGVRNVGYSPECVEVEFSEVRIM